MSGVIAVHSGWLDSMNLPNHMVYHSPVLTRLKGSGGCMKTIGEDFDRRATAIRSPSAFNQLPHSGPVLLRRRAQLNS